MAYEAAPSYYSYYPAPETSAAELSHYSLDMALAINGLASAGVPLQRIKTVIGADGLEYTELETFYC